MLKTENWPRHGSPSHHVMGRKTSGFMFSGENESLERSQWTRDFTPTPNRAEIRSQHWKKYSLQRCFLKAPEIPPPLTDSLSNSALIFEHRWTPCGQRPGCHLNSCSVSSTLSSRVCCPHSRSLVLCPVECYRENKTTGAWRTCPCVPGGRQAESTHEKINQSRQGGTEYWDAGGRPKSNAIGRTWPSVWHIPHMQKMLIHPCFFPSSHPLFPFLPSSHSNFLTHLCLLGLAPTYMSHFEGQLLNGLLRVIIL